MVRPVAERTPDTLNPGQREEGRENKPQMLLLSAGLFSFIVPAPCSRLLLSGSDPAVKMQSNAGSSAQAEAEAEDVDVEMTSPPSDSQPDDDVRRLVDEYLAEHGDEILPLKPEDIRSMLPSETMNSFALRALVESMTIQAWGQGSRHVRGQDGAEPILQLLEHMPRQPDKFDLEYAVQHLKPETDGSQRIVELIGAQMDKARGLVIFLIGPSNCEVALIGTSDGNRFLQGYLRDIRQRIPPHERCPWTFKEYNVQISGEEIGPWTCSRESELGLVLAGAFLDCLLYGFESLSDRDMGREAYDTTKISHDCLRHFLPGLHLPLGAEEEEEDGDGNNGHQVDDEEEYSSDSDDSDDSDEEEDDSDGEDNDQIENANDCDGDNITKDEEEQFEKFDFDKIMGNMSMIDMEDKDDVEKRIKRAITPLERKCMELSREIEEMIISALPTNEKVVNDMENDADIKRFVETYRQHVRTLIKSLAQFMLAAVSHDELPPCMRGWFVYIMANATEECRERLLNLLTHPSIQLLAIQYLLGQPVWWPSMFDSIKHRIDLAKSKESDDAVTAYIAVGHLSEAIHYLYNGSGTSLSPTTPLIGEAARMAGHNKVLALSLEEMVRRRRALETSLDKSILMAHTLLARSKEHFFLPSQRYPVDTRDPTDPVPGTCAALALYAENLNAILFSSCAVNHVPRSASAEPFIRISHLFIKKLRGAGLPDSPWNGANVVLPISQVPRAMWKLMKANLRVEIASAFNDKLRQYFAEEGKATLRRSVCLAMLDSEDLPLAEPYVKALRLLYADILTEHGLKYRTYHEDKTLRLIILWVAIIHEVESCSLVTPPDEDDEDDEHYDRYHFEDDTLDWVNVSVKAREIAPFDLRDDYSEDDCRKLYNAGKSKFFNRNVLLRSNWNRLRHGIPKKISKSSSMMRHPVFIKARIRHICQVFVYQHMDIGGLIRESPRAWEDAALEALINGELFRACKLLEGGLTLAVANKWERLEELDSEWAGPRNSSVTVITDVKAQQGLRHWDPNSLPTDHDDNDDKLQRLLDSHTKPAKVFQAKERASQHRSEAKAAAASATKDSEVDSDDEDDAFELWDRDYEPLKTRLFAPVRGRQQQLV
ncbi:hypothetical protein CEP51_009095 [Fusarium floridanum]|uniref:Uncharacterized protein n=1 Tax=Fusarium floridanum TaxID=1325733 RepID=A0A428RIS2_9HYPO|nr:hypothetical protein CEP51_009095 [Fusarium floridanum]